MLGLGVAERGCDFAAAGRPDQGGDLGLHVDGGEAGAGEGVVEVDGAVVGAATGGDEAALPGAEGDGFDGGAVEPFVLLAALDYGKMAGLFENQSWPSAVRN